MRHIVLAALVAFLSSCIPYTTSAYLGPRFDPGPDPGQFYNPRHDYSRPQIVPGTINTYTGQIVPAGGAFAWGGYRWGWNARAGAYQPMVAQQSPAADSMRAAAEVRYLDMRTQREGQEELVRLLGSRRYRRAQNAVARDLDQLGGLSAASAELMGFRPNSTVEHVPTTSAPLTGTDGAKRHERQPGQQPAVFSGTAGQRLAKVVTQQRIDSLRRAPAAAAQPQTAADSAIRAGLDTLDVEGAARAIEQAMTRLQHAAYYMARCEGVRDSLLRSGDTTLLEDLHLEIAAHKQNFREAQRELLLRFYRYELVAVAANNRQAVETDKRKVSEWLNRHGVDANAAFIRPYEDMRAGLKASGRR